METASQALNPSAPEPALVPVLLSGGSGTRLWPLSRENYPKQFLTLDGARSLLQNSVLRARAIPRAQAPTLIGGQAHRFLIAQQLREADVLDATVLLEPEGRDTAPAAAVAAHYASRHFGEDALVFLMAADHVIADQAAFLAAVEQAAALARGGRIVTFGVPPTAPETGFGYILGGAVIDGSGAYEVSRFVEKPDLQRAREFLEEGGYWWNSGMFMFRADVFLAELERFEAPLSRCAHAALSMAQLGGEGLQLQAEAFASCRKVSLDYALMEKLDGIALVPLDAGWNDVGSWSFLANLPAHDAHDNHGRGDILAEDARGNLVHAEHRLVAMVGVENHVIVETPDVVLVAPRDRAQDVKRVVQTLKKTRRPEAENHTRVYRPWGFYETIAGGSRFQVKRIQVNPGAKLSLQMHHHRAEHWVVVRGTATVTCGERQYLLSEDQSTYIPLGEVHRLENPGMVPLELIEVQSGAYLGEDDIVRFEDVYGRGEAPVKGEETAEPVEVPQVVASA